MIFSIFKFVCTRFSNIVQTIHQWKYYLFSFQMMHTSQFPKIDAYDWFCAPGSHFSNNNFKPQYAMFWNACKWFMIKRNISERVILNRLGVCWDAWAVVPGWPVVLLAGGVSGMCGWVVGTPMDVIKARLQVSGVSGRRYRGFFHCVSHSVRSEGLSVLFRGLTLNCIRAFPVNMSVFATYELVLRFLRPAS